MKNQFIIPSVIIAAAILGGFWMLKSPAELPKAPEITIWEAIDGGEIEVLKAVIADGSNVNAQKTSNGWTPLHYAARWGHKEVVELLIAAGADVNVKFEDYGETPLHFAVIEGHAEIAELLIVKGADVNAKNVDGERPLDWAIRRKHPEIADLLRKHGGKTAEELGTEGK